jgi:hypothetical protein
MGFDHMSRIVPPETASNVRMRSMTAITVGIRSGLRGTEALPMPSSLLAAVADELCDRE